MIYETLKEYKNSNNLTAQELSEIIKTSIHFTWKLLWGKKIPHPKKAKKISEITGVPIMNLLFPEDVRKD